MKLCVGAGGVCQKGFPCIVVEARVEGPVSVEYSTLRIVVELDPKTVELDILEEVLHVLIFVIKWALRSTSDDVVSSGCLNQAS